MPQAAGRSRSLPLFWPGAVSPAKVYSGCPSKVAWTEPSDRLIVPKVPVTGCGHRSLQRRQPSAHVPLHLDVVGVSGAKDTA